MDNFEYYYFLQLEARKRAMDAINNRIKKSNEILRWDNLTLCSVLGQSVGDALMFAANEWPKSYPSGYSGFARSWENIVGTQINDPDHFNLAIWQKINGNQVLAALAIGNPSHARTHLTLKYIERYFGDTYLKGKTLWPILTCAEEYAKLIGSKRVLIKDPVDSGIYERYGYSEYKHPYVAHGGCYLGKEL